MGCWWRSEPLPPAVHKAPRPPPPPPRYCGGCGCRPPSRSRRGVGVARPAPHCGPRGCPPRTKGARPAAGARAGAGAGHRGAAAGRLLRLPPFPGARRAFSPGAGMRLLCALCPTLGARALQTHAPVVNDTVARIIKREAGGGAGVRAASLRCCPARAAATRCLFALPLRGRCTKASQVKGASFVKFSMRFPVKGMDGSVHGEAESPAAVTVV